MTDEICESCFTHTAVSHNWNAEIHTGTSSVTDKWNEKLMFKRVGESFFDYDYLREYEAQIWTARNLV